MISLADPIQTSNSNCYVEDLRVISKRREAFSVFRLERFWVGFVPLSFSLCPKPKSQPSIRTLKSTMDRQFLGGLISPSSTLVQKDLHFIKCSCDSDEDRGFAEVGSGGSLLLTPHADGTASEVFRARPSSISNSKNIAQEATTAIKKAGGLEEWVCIKRVILEGQPKPHDVVREIRSLLKIKDLNSNVSSGTV